MKVWVAEWTWTDGYEHSNGVIGLYYTEEAAICAGENSIDDSDEGSGYSVIEMEVKYD